MSIFFASAATELSERLPATPSALTKVIYVAWCSPGAANGCTAARCGKQGCVSSHYFVQDSSADDDSGVGVFAVRAVRTG
ncbi:MAG: hypothetical protein DMG85_08170 [Acidobacteria bacterium]|nr:MAG: hypothetical protein DMG85_08170 [Acidobacteriota bacterium]